MIDRQLKDIEIVSLGLDRLKGIIGLSRIDDAEWEAIAGMLDDYAYRIRKVVDIFRPGRQVMEPGRRIPTENSIAQGG